MGVNVFNPESIAFDGADIWVVNLSGSVTKLRASDGFSQGTFLTGSFPLGGAFDGANVWVTNGLDNTVSKF